MSATGRLRILTSISYDAALLPQFVKYYRRLGIETFDIRINEQRPGIRDEVEMMVAKLGSGITLHDATAWQVRTGLQGASNDDLRRRVASADDWIIPADLDEFIQFPLSLEKLIGKMIEGGAQYVSGRFSDRIAKDGVLAATAPSPDIWEQYPMEANVTARLVKGLCTKVVLCRADCELSDGHHFVRGAGRMLGGVSGRVHHFKWRSGLVEALERRVAIYRREKVWYVHESERVLAYLTEHGRIVPEHFAAKAGWQP